MARVRCDICGKEMLASSLKRHQQSERCRHVAANQGAQQVAQSVAAVQRQELTRQGFTPLTGMENSPALALLAVFPPSAAVVGMTKFIPSSYRNLRAEDMLYPEVWARWDDDLPVSILAKSAAEYAHRYPVPVRLAAERGPILGRNWEASSLADRVALFLRLAEMARMPREELLALLAAQALSQEAK